MSQPEGTKRKVFARLSIAVGNTLQIAGIVAAYLALMASRSTHSTTLAVASMLPGAPAYRALCEGWAFPSLPDVVCGCHCLGHHSDFRSVVRMAFRCSLERMVLSVCSRLGIRYVGE